MFSHFEKKLARKKLHKKRKTHRESISQRIFWRFSPLKQKLATRKPKKEKEKKPQLFSHFEKKFSQKKKNFIKKKKKNTE
jgi:hypothetical protein